MKNLFQKVRNFLLHMSDTETVIYDRASEKARRACLALGVGVTVSPVVASVVLGHAFYVAFDSTIGGVLSGLAWWIFATILDFFIAGSTGRSRHVIRFGIALFVSLLTGVFGTIAFFDDRIQQRAERENRAKYQERLAEEAKARGIPGLNVRIDSAQQRLSESYADADRAIKMQDCERTGAQVEGVSCTGERGRGPEFDAAVDREEEARRRAQQIGAELARLRSRRDSLRGTIRTNNDPSETLRDPLARAETLWTIIVGSPGAAVMSAIVFLFAAMVELVVPLIQLGRSENDYDVAVEKYLGAEKQIASRRIDSFLQQRLDEIEEAPLTQQRPTLAEFLGRQAHPGPSPADEEPPREEQEEDPAAVPHAEENEGGEARQTSDHDGEQGRNGWKLFSVGGILLVAVLELATPVAPVQRLAGNALNAASDSTRADIMGQAAARRYENVERNIKEQAQRGVVSADGVVLARHTAQPDFPETLWTYLMNAENHRYDDLYVIDWWRTGGAIWNSLPKFWLANGASGVVQQLTGEFILRNSKTMEEGSTWARFVAKGKEYLVSFALRDRHSLKEIRRFYLKAIYLGSGREGAIRGFEEASWAYFDVPVRKLSEPEQVALVSIVKNPGRYVNNPSAFKGRYEGVVGTLLHDRKAIAPRKAEHLLDNRPALHSPTESNREKELRLATHHYRDFLRAHVADSTGVIRTAARADVSRASFRTLQRIARDVKDETGVRDVTGFVLVIHEGQLLAMIGSVSGKNFNRADSSASGTAYDPGSLGKPILYTGYFNQGGSTRDRLPVQGPRTFVLDSGERWTVKNYSGRWNDHPPMPAAKALARSINVSAASLAVSSVADRMRERLAGVGYADAFPHPSSFLGADAVKPLRLFRLLQAFSPPYGRIPRRFGLLQEKRVRRQRVWPRAVAERTALTLSYAVADPHGTLSGGRRHGWTSHTHRGKTGTGNEHGAASLFVARPGGVNVMVGVFSRNGENLKYENGGGGVAGAFLVPYVDELLETDALEQLTDPSFDFKGDVERLLL